MNLDRLHVGLKQARKDLYALRYPEPGVVREVEGFDARLEKLNRVHKRALRHFRMSKGRALHRSIGMRLANDLNTLREAVAQGKTLLSFDLEWNRDTGRTEEIGVTIFSRGIFQSYNLRVSHNQRGVFDFGRTEFTTLEEAVQKFLSLCDQADYYVGHSLREDFRQFRKMGINLPTKEYFDTQHQARYQYRRQHKLSFLCREYGVDCPNPHCGGNDARYTLEVLLKMAERNCQS